MKKLMYGFAIVAIGLFASCDKCKDVSCENGGTCNEGDCECTELFKGDKCASEVRADYNTTYGGGIEIPAVQQILPTTVKVENEGTDASALKYTLTAVTDTLGSTTTFEVSANLTSKTEFTIPKTRIPFSLLFPITGDMEADVTGTGYFVGDSCVAVMEIQGYPSNFTVTGGATFKGVR